MSDNALIQSLRYRVQDLEAERDDLRSTITAQKLIIADQDRQVAELRTTIAEQSRCIADQQRQIVELRGAVDALLQPAPSELLAKNMAHPSRAKGRA